MQATAIVLDKPKSIDLQDVSLVPANDGDVVVDIHWTGISTGTEKLLYEGRMPTFPGMGYPLVPGYEAVGRVVKAPSDGSISLNEMVFVPGARCYEGVNALFGANASSVVVDAKRVYPVSDTLGSNATLLALAATAHHAISLSNERLPDLVIGHGVLGRLTARIIYALSGYTPTVWERNDARREGATNYEVIDGENDTRKDYSCILDASGTNDILDLAVSRLAPKGEIVLAGFYDQPLSLNFPPAFMREAQFRIAAEFTSDDVQAVLDLVSTAALSLDGLISHATDTANVGRAYETAFSDPSCIKMILDWRKNS